MLDLTINIKDAIHCSLFGLTPEDLNLCVKTFKVFIPSAIHQPTYKLGRWDGYKSYFSVTSQTYVSLLPQILALIDAENKYYVKYVYAPNVIPAPEIVPDVDENYMSDITWPEGSSLAGKPVVMAEHQVRCVNALLEAKRGLLEAATSSGKTLMGAALCRKILPYGKVVFIVPYKDLLFQTAKDLIGFGIDVGRVGAGLREFGHDVTICMWQTLNSLEKRKKSSEVLLSQDEISKITQDVICMIFDETHMAKGYQVQEVVSKVFPNVPLRMGLTGTIPKEKSDYIAIMTAIGPRIEERVTAKELQDIGFSSKCEVTCLRLEDKKPFDGWINEKNYLITNGERAYFIANFIKQVVETQSNTLVLVDRISYGEHIEKLLKTMGVDVIFLNGKNSKAQQRAEEYKKIATTNNKCIIAIDKIASTGLNVPRLFNLVFLDFGKSFTKTIQSVGRGLRKAFDKDFVNIYDISSTTVYSRKHFNDRVKFYNDAQYPLRIIKIDKWK